MRANYSKLEATWNPPTQPTNDLWQPCCDLPPPQTCLTLTVGVSAREPLALEFINLFEETFWWLQA
jgi:hypothetical protein